MSDLFSASSLSCQMLLRALDEGKAAGLTDAAMCRGCSFCSLRGWIQWQTCHFVGLAGPNLGDQEDQMYMGKTAYIKMQALDSEGSCLVVVLAEVVTGLHQPALSPPRFHGACSGGSKLVRLHRWLKARTPRRSCFTDACVTHSSQRGSHPPHGLLVKAALQRISAES